MKENQNEEEVLLMADKDDDSKLKAVDKSAAKEGIWRLLLPQWKLPYSRLLSGYDGRVYRHAGISRRQQDLIDLYKINPNDYPILVQEQKSPTATE